MAFETKRNPDKLKAVMRELAVLGRIRVKAGSMGGQRRERDGSFGKSNATILAYHEFGGPNGNDPPKRMPVRRGLLKAQRQINATFRAGVEKIHAGSAGANAAMEAVGEVVVRAIKDGIRSGLSPALRPSTLAKPGRDPRGIPLLDTEQLLDSIEAKAEVE